MFHPSLSKNMKSTIQIKRDKMLFINATLSKNQLHELKNQINKVPTTTKQDHVEFFSKYFCTSFYYCLQFTFVLS